MLSQYLCCCCWVAKSCLTLCRLHGLLCPWDFPGKNTGVVCHFILQGIFLIQGLNLYLCLAGRFFTTEPLGSLSQYIFRWNVMIFKIFKLLQNIDIKFHWIIHSVTEGLSEMSLLQTYKVWGFFIFLKEDIWWKCIY